MNAATINSWNTDLHQQIALMLRRDPKLVRIFADRLRSQMASARSSDAISDTHWEWHVILNLYRPLEVIRLLEDSSEQATRLRRTSPFASLLSEDEKKLGVEDPLLQRPQLMF